MVTCIVSLSHYIFNGTISCGTRCVAFCSFPLQQFLFLCVFSVEYIVRDGDSMHSISQKFGIRLKNLYKMNKLDDDYVPEVGDRLKLR